MDILPRELTVKPADVTMTYGGSAELTVEYINLAPGETEADLGGTAFAYTQVTSTSTKNLQEPIPSMQMGPSVPTTG